MVDRKNTEKKEDKGNPHKTGEGRGEQRERSGTARRKKNFRTTEGFEMGERERSAA